MKYESILAWANEIAEDQNFVIKKELYHGIYYKKDVIRNIILLGEYKSKPAVLKVYNDPRFTDEPKSLQAFLEINTSKKLIAPQLYAFEQIDDHRGWMIMEYLDDGAFLQTPLSKEHRLLFLELFREYKQHFPTTPHRPLSEMEQLDSFLYTKQKFELWQKDFLLVEQERKEQGKRLYNSPQFQSIYEKTLHFIEKAYTAIPLEWVHGHFKPQELFLTNHSLVYLTDFAHTKMVPRGYELAFIIWADTIMSLPTTTPYTEWEKSIHEWIDLIKPQLKSIDLDLTQFEAALAERIMGTLLRDFGSSDKTPESIEQMFNLGMQYLQDMVN